MNYPCSLIRTDDHIYIEDIKRKNLNLDDDSQKMGEINIKDKKYYFIPYKKENMTEINGDELFAWLIFKGDKFPLNKNSYRLKEGDIIKLGRIWLIVRVIHIPTKTKKEKRLEVKDTDCIQVSYHNQGNHSLNLKDDFKEDYKIFANDKLLDNSDDSDSDSEKKNKNKINFIDDAKDTKDKEKKVEKNNNSQKICRICYLEEENPLLNPLIRPCKCSGSMKYIHLKCLIVWIKTKVEIDNSEYLENGKYVIYSSEKVECELCKEVFPNYVRHNNKLYNLMDFEQNFGDEENNENNIIITESENNNNNNNTNTNNSNKKSKKKKEDNVMRINTKKDSYIVFDSIPIEKNSPAYRYIAKFSNNLLKIGRGIDMDLIMNDLSISRNHCHLELNENGEILLTDANSKFGTLILVQAKKIEILENQTLTIQVGRTFFNIGYKKNNSLFSCCQAEEIDLTKSYEKINYKAVKFNKFCQILTENENDDNDNEEIQIEKEEPKKESEYEQVLKDINNNKNNNKEKKKERLKTFEEKNNKELIESSSKINNIENNKTFQIEKNSNTDF